MQDRDGALLILNRRTRPFFPFIERIFADAAYQGPKDGGRHLLMCNQTISGVAAELKPMVLTDVEYEIEPAGESIPGVRYLHQQFAPE